MEEKLSLIKEKYLPFLKSNKKAVIYLTVGFIIIVLIFISEIPKEENENANSVESGSYDYIDNTKLEKFLENLSGAGNVKVMITYDDSSEHIYACDTSENVNMQADGNKESDYKSQHIIIENGNEEDGLVIKEIYPKIRGVAVICDGGNNPLIKEQIIDILSALFDINSNRISVAAKAA